MLRNYSKSCPRYVHSHSMLDRETKKKYVVGNWTRIKTYNGCDCTGLICWIGSKLVYLAISPIGVERSVEKINMDEIISVEEIDPMWLEAGY